MDKKELRKEKQELAAKFEECFESGIEKHLTKKGLDLYWDDETPIEGAALMLDKAAMLTVIDDLFSDAKKGMDLIAIIGGFGVDDEDDEEEVPKYDPIPKGSCPKKFAVLEKEDGHVYPDRFETADDAYDFIKVICMNTPHTFDDFKVVEEM